MIIGLQGYAGSGKSTVAQYLATKHGFARRHIKQPIADMARVLIKAAHPDVWDNVLDQMIDGNMKRLPVDALGGRTPTEIQQFLGTEFGRNFIHPDTWLDIWSAWAAQHPKVVQESVRFANEAERCDVTWEVRRPGYGALNGHESEALPVEADVVILNTDSLEGLYEQVEFCLASMNEKGA